MISLHSKLISCYKTFWQIIVASNWTCTKVPLSLQYLDTGKYLYTATHMKLYLIRMSHNHYDTCMYV